MNTIPRKREARPLPIRSITVKLPSNVYDEFGRVAAQHGLTPAVYTQKLIEASIKIWGEAA